MKGTTMKRYGHFIAVIATAMSFTAAMSTPTLAQNANPLEAVATELGLEFGQLMACLPDTPQKPGQQPSEEEHAAFIGCVQAQSPSLTAEQIDGAMEALRKMPPPPKG